MVVPPLSVPPEAQKEEYHFCNVCKSSAEEQLESHIPWGVEWRVVRRADWQKQETWVSRLDPGAARHEDWACLRRGQSTAQAGKSSEPDVGIKLFASCDLAVTAKMVMMRRTMNVVEVENRGSDREGFMIVIIGDQWICFAYRKSAGLLLLLLSLSFSLQHGQLEHHLISVRKSHQGTTNEWTEM